MKIVKGVSTVLAGLGCLLLLACSHRKDSSEKVIEFDGGAASVSIRSGWSGPEKAPDGVSFCWAEGREAILATRGVGRTSHKVRLRAWSFEYPQAPQQRMTVFVNDTRVSEIAVEAAPTEYTIDTPWSVWSDRENVLRFRFSRADAPSDRIPESKDRRRLAAAFDWVRVVPG